MKITKIVLTGGPCAGKTTALRRIEKEFGEKGRGYKVLFVPETATELISGGLAPWTCGTNLDYQKCQVALQKFKERMFEQGARTMPVEKVLIVCDRGVLDNKAYMTKEEFAACMRELGTSEIQEREQYDAVIHLVTAAKGALESYTLSNNTARTETPEEAAALDDRLIAAWTGHPHLRVIDNSGNFEEKLRRVNAEIAVLLGEPEPLEIERKFLIRYPDIGRLESLPNCKKVDIVQTYLVGPEGLEVRVRRRGQDGSYVYYRTEKRRLSETTRTERETRLTQKEYSKALLEADPARRPVRKTRYLLTENGRYYEIDVHPEWKRQAVMEIELSHPEEPFTPPAGIEILRELTGIPAYSNHEMALHMPEEE